MSAEKEQFYDDCSFVSIHYIICECGETFPSENGLRAHLEKEHPHKRERKEFKCGVCGSIFGLEEDCIDHYAEQHMDAEVKEEDSSDEETQADVEHEITEETDDGTQVEIEEGMVLEQVTEETLEDQEFQQEEMVEIHLDPETGAQHRFKLEQTTLEEEHDYVQETHETELEHVIHEEESTHLVKVEAGQGISQDEVTQATEMLLKDNGTKEFPQPKPRPLKMVRDASSGQLVLVFNRSKPKKPVSKKPATRKQAHKHIICEVCGRNYASNAALKYHQRVHSGEKPYQCQLCPKSFTMPLFLQIHIRTHTGERPYPCVECPKAFSNKAALLRHSRVHTGEKPYLCPMCYKSFTQSNSMKLHVATVHLKQPAPYKSRNRRLKEMNSKHSKQLNTKIQAQSRIKAFAPSHPQPSEAPASDGEFEVVISEEIEEDPDTCYEIVYTEP